MTIMSRSLRKISVVLVCLGCWNLLISCRTPLAEAAVYSAPLSLLSCDDLFFHLTWPHNGAFADILKRTSENWEVDHSEPQKLSELHCRLKGLTRKIRINFAPRVFIKPFILVEELRDLLVVYTSRRSSSKMLLGEDAQLKTDSASSILSQVKKIMGTRSRRSFSVSPYYNRIYGLHLEILW